MFEKEEILRELKRQLSIDLNCRPEDFDAGKNILTVPAANPGRRVYADETFFFRMVTLGRNAVISADESLHPWLARFVKDQSGFRLFEHPHLMELETQLAGYGKALGPTHHAFLPDTRPLKIQPDFQVEWFEGEKLFPLYEKKFYNALCSAYDPRRPDLLAVAAVIDGEIAGLAGCSADGERLWQIGIDVLPAYRSRGIGATLVGLLKEEIFKRGAIPFYGTDLSNLHSWNIAIKCGFRPAWVEVATVEP